MLNFQAIHACIYILENADAFLQNSEDRLNNLELIENVSKKIKYSFL